MLAIGMAGETLLFEALSNLIGRARPPTQIWIILKIPGFPSGHTMAAVTFWTPGIPAGAQNALCLWEGLRGRTGNPDHAFYWFTRVFTAAHYFTDVLAAMPWGLPGSACLYAG